MRALLPWRHPRVHVGRKAGGAYLFVHGKQSRKEAAELFAQIAARKGLQTLSFDLSGHGERADAAPLDVFNGTRDLKLAASYAFRRWERVSLYACSIGAYFSLQALTESPFERALFQSPPSSICPGSQGR